MMIFQDLLTKNNKKTVHLPLLSEYTIHDVNETVKNINQRGGQINTQISLGVIKNYAPLSEQKPPENLIAIISIFSLDSVKSFRDTHCQTLERNKWLLTAFLPYALLKSLVLPTYLKDLKNLEYSL